MAMPGSPKYGEITGLIQITIAEAQDETASALVTATASLVGSTDKVAQATQNLVASTDKVAESTKRLSGATWALVVVSALLALAAVVQAVAMFRHP